MKNIIKNHQNEVRLFQRRLLIVGIFILVLTGILLARLFYLQVWQHKLYNTLSEQNHLILLPVEPNRGLIYDRNGILLADNKSIFSLDVVPAEVENLDEELAILQKILPLTPEEREDFDNNWEGHQRLKPIPIKINLTQDEVFQFYLDRYRLPGFSVNVHSIRYYPEGPDLVSVLGYMSRINAKDLKNIDAVNYSASNFIGKIGIEKSYEDMLHGTIGYQQVEIDASSRIVRVLKRIQPQAGSNIYLTIDSKLQKTAQNAFGKENGGLVAINPQNGEVLAMVSSPTYDPNLFVAGISQKVFKNLQNSPDKPMYNRSVRGQFSPGSTIKPFLAIQGLDSGVITPDYTINDPGWFKLPNSTHIYHDWTHLGHGTVNVAQSIIVSCDTFFYNLAVKLGITAIDNILHRFDFGQKTGIDLGEELSGIVPSPEWKLAKTGSPWYPGYTVITGIGQGFMLTTPLQLAHATAGIAMRGLLFRPHLLYKTQDYQGRVSAVKPTLNSKIVLKKNKTWDVVIKAMQGVITSVNPWGTGRIHFGTDAKYTVAAKTGTAQLFRHYLDENQSAEETRFAKRLRNHSLFIAFAPVDHPKIAIAVVAENSVIAGSIARKVLDSYLLPKEQLNNNTPKATQISTNQSDNQDEEEPLSE
ncbi:MAG: penicillin-binding protein 2 [Gammaproteobacteria bacterium]